MEATGSSTSARSRVDTAPVWTSAEGGADEAAQAEDVLSDGAMRDLILHRHAIVFLPGPVFEDGAAVAPGS